VTTADDPLPPAGRETIETVERALAGPKPERYPDHETAIAGIRDAIHESIGDATDPDDGDAETSIGDSDAGTDDDTGTDDGDAETSIGDSDAGTDDDTGIDDGDAGDVAVAFSGGVDSAILDAPCYVVGFPESHDVEAARSAANVMDLDLTVVELDHDTLEAAVPRVARAIGRENAMDVQIALPLFLVAERVASDGFDRLAVGQGADELFGGYAKVANAPGDDRVDADTVDGARREVMPTLPDQLDRDVRALAAAGVTPVAPFLHESVIRAARKLPPGLVVSDDGHRKHALRLAATEWVPESIAFREKKAVQYGSLVGRELDRLARQDGYKRRMDDHVTKYVRSRL
jgi:asparagine synthase (glutamine-hydrolysing)